jgi:tRNA synthetases class I (I, L, M and V)
MDRHRSRGVLAQAGIQPLFFCCASLLLVLSITAISSAYVARTLTAHICFHCSMLYTEISYTAVTHCHCTLLPLLLLQTVTVPMQGREIPVIADTYVDREFGTGALKITPGHDVNDYAIGKTHSLPTINILNKVLLTAIAYIDVFTLWSMY